MTKDRIVLVDFERKKITLMFQNIILTFEHYKSIIKMIYVYQIRSLNNIMNNDSQRNFLLPAHLEEEDERGQDGDPLQENNHPVISENISNIHDFDNLYQVKNGQFFCLVPSKELQSIQGQNKKRRSAGDQDSDRFDPEQQVRIDNNLYKKFITILNSCISQSGRSTIKRLFRKINKFEKTSSNKGSRYGFVCSLLNIRLILGQDSLLQTFQEFREKEKGITDEELLNISWVYLQSYRQFMKGNYEDSIESLYREIQGFRHPRYLQQGKRKVRKYREQLEKYLQ